jgi:hypothetical protein
MCGIGGRKLQLMLLFRAWKEAIMVAACAAFISRQETPKRQRGKQGNRLVYARVDWQDVEWMKLFLAVREERSRGSQEQQQDEVEGGLVADLQHLWVDEEAPPISRNQKRFQAITRVPMPLFLELLRLTEEHKLFGDTGVDAAHRRGVPLALRLMIVLNILGEGRFLRGFETDQGVG